MILICNYAGKYDTSIVVGLNHVQIINSFISSRACVIKRTEQQRINSSSLTRLAIFNNVPQRKTFSFEK